VITGATGVYGRQFAARFASLGSRLFLTDRDATALASLAAEFTDAEAVETFAADLTSEQDLLGAFRSRATRLGAPDTVILNAGIYPFGGLFDTSIETFDRIFDVNVRANFVLTQRLART
jgi:short-subunit dehydrogenase